MLLEVTLYLLIGFTGLLILKTTSPKSFMKDILYVILWPYYFLLKYIELVEMAKQNRRNW